MAGSSSTSDEREVLGLIVSREPELAALVGCVQATARGESKLVVVEGEPGIGKTRLVDELCRIEANEDVSFLRGIGEELQRERPFGVVAAALPFAAVAEVMRATGDDTDRRYQIVEAIEDVVEREVMQEPIVLVIEDLHWADAGSILALHRLARRDDLPLLCLFTCRPVPRSNELQRLIDAVDDHGGLHLRLGPLPVDAVAELARSRIGTGVGPRLSEQLERAGGNPLFVLELLRGLAHDNLIEVHDGVAEVPAAVESPASLRALIVRRLRILDPLSIETLRVAAVLGESFSAADLAAVMSRSLAAVLDRLAEPLAAGFVAGDSDAFAFRHDLVREALYAEIPPAVRKAMHLHTARCLSAAGAEPIRVAQHVALGAELGDRQAVDWLRDAAMDVASRAPATAAGLLQRAAELLPVEDPDRPALLLPAIRQLTSAGRVTDANELVDRLAASVEGGPLEILLAIERLNILVLQLRIDEMAAYAETLLDKPYVPEEYRVELRVLNVGARAFLQDASALRELETIRPWTDAHPVAIGTALVCWLDGLHAWAQGRFAAAAGHFESAIPGLSAFGRAGQSLGLAAAARGLADRFEESFQMFQASRTELEQRGLVQYLIEDHWLRGSLLFAVGRWDDALAEVSASRDLSAETGAVGSASVVADSTPLIYAFRGEARAVLATLDSASSPVLSGGMFTNWTATIRAVVSECAGDQAGALDTLRSWGGAMDELAFVPDFRSTARTLVRVARRDDALLDALRRGAEQACAAAGNVKSAEAAAMLVLGAIASDPDMLLAAVDAARAGGRPFDVAEACAEAGVGLLRCQDQAGAVDMLDEAFAGYDALGADVCAAVLAHELREFGVRRRRRGSPGRARHGWEALTPTERRVVELVAEGLSNADIGRRLYVSKGTVATHLRSVFRKVRVTSRTELAAEASRRTAAATGAQISSDR